MGNVGKHRQPSNSVRICTAHRTRADCGPTWQDAFASRRCLILAQCVLRLMGSPAGTKSMPETLKVALAVSAVRGLHWRRVHPQVTRQRMRMPEGRPALQTPRNNTEGRHACQARAVRLPPRALISSRSSARAQTSLCVSSSPPFDPPQVKKESTNLDTSTNEGSTLVGGEGGLLQHERRMSGA